MSDVRYCPSCGAQVSANERFCGNCGTRMEPPAPAPTAPTAPLGQQGSEPTQVLPPAQPSSPPPAFGQPAPGAAPSFGVPADAGSAAAPTRRGLPIWAIILLTVGGLCAIGCAASFLALNLVGQRVSSVFTTVQTELDVTAGPAGQGGGIVNLPTSEGDAPTNELPAPTNELPAPTAAAIPTLAPTSSGGGIIGSVNTNSAAARTAEAATAEVVQATAAAAQASGEVEAAIAAGRQVFRDEFVDNRNNWFTGTFNDIEIDKIEDGVFKVIWSGDSTSYELYEVRELTDFVADVDCLVRQGGTNGSCGLVFAQKNDVGYYKFEVFDDYYRLFVVQSGGGNDPVMLAEGDPAGIVRPGDVNSLRIYRRGDLIEAFLNGSLLTSVHDSTYSSGKVGVSTDSYSKDGGVEVWFDNFTIWEL